MQGLYTNKEIHSFLSLTRGEGFGLPLFDAAANGMPIVATGWSAHNEFLTTDNTEHYDKVKYDLRDVSEETIKLYPNMFEPGMKWAQCREKSAKKQMRTMYENFKYKKRRAAKLSEIITKQYTEDAMYERMTNSVLSAVNNKVELANWLEDLGKVRVY